jgi:DNA-binding transcriptional ArsR family regulator
MALSSSRELDVFGAISHPARRRMLDLLRESDRSVNTITGSFQMSRPAVSQHLRVLLDAGLVTEQRYGRERRYRLVPERLKPVQDWIAHYEMFWDDHLSRLQKHLAKGSKHEQEDPERTSAPSAAGTGLAGHLQPGQPGGLDVPE